MNQRNKPCRCGSGKKTKVCCGHGSRSGAGGAGHPSVIIKQAYSQKMCLHGGASPPCNTVVSAHTVSKSSSLLPIAEKGHVVGLRQGGSGGPSIGLIGVNRASVMNGFCSTHDASVFVSLDRVPFTATDEQLWLLHYRSLCHEIYKKRCSAQAFTNNRHFGPVVTMLAAGNASGLSVLEGHLKRMAADFAARQWGSIRGYVLWCDSLSPIVCAGPINPDNDMAGAALLDSVNASWRNDVVALSIVGVGPRSAVVLTWRQDSRLPGEQLARSIEPLADRAEAAARLVFSCSENWFARSSWWANLGVAERKDVMRRAVNGLLPGAFAPAHLSTAGVHLGMPTSTYSSCVGWSV